MDALIVYRQIERYQRELKKAGFADEHRDFKLQPREHRTIPSSDQMFFMVYCPDEVVITSNLGVYNQLSDGVAENQHVHSGELTLENYSDGVQNVEFVHVLWA